MCLLTAPYLPKARPGRLHMFSMQSYQRSFYWLMAPGEEC